MVKYTTLHLWFTPTGKYKVTQKVHAKSLKGSTLQAGFSFTHTNRYTQFFLQSRSRHNTQHSHDFLFPFNYLTFLLRFVFFFFSLSLLLCRPDSWLVLASPSCSFLVLSSILTPHLYIPFFFFFNSFRAPLKNRPLFKFLRIPITGKPSKSSFFFIIICVFYFLHFPFSSTTLLFVHTCMLLMNTDSETVLLLLIFGFAWIFCLYVVFHFQLGVLFFFFFFFFVY